MPIYRVAATRRQLRKGQGTGEKSDAKCLVVMKGFFPTLCEVLREVPAPNWILPIQESWVAGINLALSA